MHPERRRFLLAGAAGLMLPHLPAAAQAAPLLRKRVPSSGEEIPIVGLGTARRYQDAGSPEEGARRRETLARFAALGAAVIDTAPVYGDAEQVVGALLRELGLREKLFLATKVSTGGGREAGVRQIEDSFRRLGTSRIDLIAVHNLRDTDVQLATLRELKQAGRIRYVGITTSFDRQYADFEATMRRERLDWIQVDYALVMLTSPEQLEHGPGGVGGFLRDGTAVPLHVARMLACDCKRVSRRRCGASGSTGSRSTTRSTTARPGSASCRSPPSAAWR